MIVIADGDVAKNHLLKGSPLPLGADKYSFRPDSKTMPPVMYANNNFLQNSLDYLLDDNNLLELRNSSIEVNLLDETIISNERKVWQLFNIILPILFLWLIGIIFIIRRRNSFS